MFDLGRFWLFEPVTKIANAFIDIGGEKIIKVFDVAAGEETEDEGGGAAPFKKISYASTLKQISKGGKNKLTIKPRVLIENMIDDSQVIQTLGGAITDVGQVFKLTGGIKNLERVHLTLEADAGGAITNVEDFESYADTAALRAAWVPNDITNTPNTLETSIVGDGSQAMAVEMKSKQKSKNDNFERTFGSSQDWSQSNGIQFKFRNNGSPIIEIHITDASGDGSKHTITTSGTGSFELLQLDFSDFVPVGAVPADLTAIEKVKIFIKTADLGFFYIDTLELFSTQNFGNVDLELVDFGTDPAPTTLGTVLTTVNFDLESGKKIYEIEFEADNLTSNNFYGLVLTNPSAATVKVYGKNGSDLYSSGFAFDSTDGAAIAATGSGDDLFFLTFARDKAIFNGIRFTTNADPGQGKVSAFINNNASKKGKTTLFLGEGMQGRTEVDFPTKQQTNVGVRMDRDELVLVDYEDDGGSLASKIQATVYFTFIDRPANG